MEDFGKCFFPDGTARAIPPKENNADGEEQPEESVRFIVETEEIG